MGKPRHGVGSDERDAGGEDPDFRQLRGPTGYRSGLAPGEGIWRRPLPLQGRVYPPGSGNVPFGRETRSLGRQLEGGPPARGVLGRGVRQRVPWTPGALGSHLENGLLSSSGRWEQMHVSVPKAGSPGVGRDCHSCRDLGPESCSGYAPASGIRTNI